MTTPDPARHGIPPRAVLDLLDDLERPGLEPHALAITRRGEPVLEATWAPYRADLPGLVYSVSKTFTAAAVGHLVAEGRLAVDDLAGKILGLPDPTGITVRHLLSMNTGHSAEQVAGLGFDSGELLGTVPAHAPGTHFVYNSQASMALSSVVTTLTGQRLTEYLRPRMLEPLGIDDPWWVPHRDGELGIEQGFSGLHLTIGQLTRLAVALADGGRYRGAQVVPAAWVAEMRRAWSDNADSPGATHDWAQGYGYQVWRSRHGFRADGAYGQFGLALPEHGLAIGYLGATRATHEVLDAFWRFADRVADAPLDADPEAAARLAARLAALDTWPRRLDDDPAPTPSDVVSPVPWVLHERAGAWRVDVGGHLLDVGEDAWRTHVVDRPHLAPAGEPYGAGSVVDPVLVLALRARRVGDVVEVDAVVPTSPHRLVARGTPGGSLDLAWTTTPLWHPGLSTLVVPGALAAPAR
ncbi:serine hydrolase domain-containing protein [Isoptericola sp. NPDC019482]|uniref:serine hydrolase domain-containing protein n=1 Tax=Isoptericola sp. NPDC019482 TaxID=3154688 RepID=UPI00347D51C4